jgi:hypothetical protein
MHKRRYVAAQITGAAVMVFGTQAVIRLLFNHHRSPIWGVLDWLPGGWGGQAAAFAALVALGVLLAGWADDRIKAGEAAQ